MSLVTHLQKTVADLCNNMNRVEQERDTALRSLTELKKRYDDLQDQYTKLRIAKIKRPTSVNLDSEYTLEQALEDAVYLTNCRGDGTDRLKGSMPISLRDELHLIAGKVREGVRTAEEAIHRAARLCWVGPHDVLPGLSYGSNITNGEKRILAKLREAVGCGSTLAAPSNHLCDSCCSPGPIHNCDVPTMLQHPDYFGFADWCQRQGIKVGVVEGNYVLIKRVPVYISLIAEASVPLYYRGPVDCWEELLTRAHVFKDFSSVMAELWRIFVSKTAKPENPSAGSQDAAQPQSGLEQQDAPPR